VAWHVFLYLSCQFVEFSPALFEWLGWRRVRKWAMRLTLGATIFGVMLSTLHQSALGALFLLAPGKLHPLWYSPLLPLFFFVSSIFAGISVVIVESTLSSRAFGHKTGPEHEQKLNRLSVGLAKAGAVVMYSYFGIKLIGIMHSNGWGLLGTPLGQWFLVELVGFVLVPCLLYAWGYATRSVRLIRWTAALAVVGVILNRLNVSIIAFNWQETERYVPRWSEVVITIAIITAAVLTFRWIVNRMPVLHQDPSFESEF